MTKPIVKPGQIHSRVSLANGETAILRAPNWNDLDDLIEYINGLVEEHAHITKTEKVTREAEAEWLGQRLAEIENGHVIHLVAEVAGKVVGAGEVSQLPEERSHTGYLGIGISESHRGHGLGTTLMQALIELSKKTGLKILILDVFATNNVAVHLYEKIGFKETGRIPKGIYRDGNYIDIVRMTTEL
ncbi:MAG: N-acetyltransferase family protein [Candidatus Bathyarchaeia archaeon]